MKKQLLAIIVTLSLSFGSVSVYAHSGNTDVNGGHYDYDNVSGLGSYHYHHGYPAHLHINNVCPYKDLGVDTTFYFLYSETCAYKLVWLTNDVSNSVSLLLDVSYDDDQATLYNEVYQLATNTIQVLKNYNAEITSSKLTALYPAQEYIASYISNSEKILNYCQNIHSVQNFPSNDELLSVMSAINDSKFAIMSVCNNINDLTINYINQTISK